jgi:glycosyltransferase involved in cell wall biosynthesis
MKQEMRRELRVDEAKLAVLPNPVDSSLIRSAVEIPNPSRNEPRPRLLAIGRLVPEKGFDMLLEAFAGVSTQLPQVTLTVAGCGTSEDSLKQQSRRLGIADRVRFSGHVPNPAQFFRDASLFVLSSRTEGIPNALLEAAFAGLPIVATPASGGLTDLLAGKEGVWLADEISVPALKVALEAALTAIKPGQRYPHSWIEPFDISRAIPAYEAAIDRALEGTAR